MDEANLLFERQSYGHALSLSLFSIEESVKSWICYSVGIGAESHNHEIVKKVFESHSTKMELVTLAIITAKEPLLQKSFFYELDEEERKQVSAHIPVFDIPVEHTIQHMVKLRSKGIYVDKTSNPNDISKDDVEGFLIDAYEFCKMMETLIDGYENLDDEATQEHVDAMKKIAKIANENWRKINNDISP